jgi:hypothetical protein
MLSMENYFTVNLYENGRLAEAKEDEHCMRGLENAVKSDLTSNIHRHQVIDTVLKDQQQKTNPDQLATAYSAASQLHRDTARLFGMRDAVEVASGKSLSWPAFLAMVSTPDTSGRIQITQPKDLSYGQGKNDKTFKGEKKSAKEVDRCEEKSNTRKEKKRKSKKKSKTKSKNKNKDLHRTRPKPIDKISAALEAISHCDDGQVHEQAWKNPPKVIVNAYTQLPPKERKNHRSRHSCLNHQHVQSAQKHATLVFSNSTDNSSRKRPDPIKIQGYCGSVKTSPFLCKSELSRRM